MRIAPAFVALALSLLSACAVHVSERVTAIIGPGMSVQEAACLDRRFLTCEHQKAYEKTQARLQSRKAYADAKKARNSLAKLFRDASSLP